MKLFDFRETLCTLCALRTRQTTQLTNLTLLNNTLAGRQTQKFTNPTSEFGTEPIPAFFPFLKIENLNFENSLVVSMCQLLRLDRNPA